MKNLLKLIAATVICLGMTNGVVHAQFSDIQQTNGNYIAILHLQETGVIQGYEDGTFRPDQLVNRVEALKIILEGNGVEIPEVVEESSFSDVEPGAWFARYVEGAKNLGIVSGNPDGSFAPARNVGKSEFVKMLLNTNGFKKEKWENLELFPDVPKDAWFNAYMNYAGQAGLVPKDENNNLNPGQELTRGEVAETLYIMKIILKGTDTQFLITQAEKQMTQIDVYVGNNDPIAAKRASELGVDMTQQAYKNLPDDNTVMGAAKLARAYDFLVNAYAKGIQQEYDECRDWAQQSKDKATEAWEVNNETQPIARHIKDRADEIVNQIPAE